MADRLEVVRCAVVGDVPAEQLARHVRAAVVEAGPDAGLDELGEWLRERVERADLDAAAAGNLEKLVIWKPPSARRRRTCRSTVTFAASRQLCPETHSGYGAVMSAVQVGSAAVAGLPSSAARAIAFHGRQKSKWYLSFQQLIDASAAAHVLQREESGAVGGVEVVPCDELRGRPRSSSRPGALCHHLAMYVWSVGPGRAGRPGPGP